TQDKNQRRFNLRATRLTERLADAAERFADLAAFEVLRLVLLMTRRALDRALVAARTTLRFSSVIVVAVRLAAATTLPAAVPRVSPRLTSTSSSADAVISSPFERISSARIIRFQGGQEHREKPSPALAATNGGLGRFGSLNLDRRYAVVPGVVGLLPDSPV